MSTPTKEQRELDAWIAVNVMGWIFIDRKAVGWGDGPDVYGTGDCKNPTFQDFTPTTDRRCAMLVLEKCADDIDGDMIQYWRDGIWHCLQLGSSRRPDMTVYNGTTLPEAICLFAKALLEGK